jgi:hypothetical protein
MRFYVYDKDNNELDLTSVDQAWTIAPTSIEVKQTVADRYKQYGSTIISDNYFGARKFSLQFKVISGPKTTYTNSGQIDSYYNDIVNKIIYFFRAEQYPFYLEDRQTVGAYKRIKIQPGNFSEDYNVGMEKRFGTYTYNFLAVDALWENPEITAPTTTYATDKFIEIELPKYAYETYFKLVYTQESADYTTIMEVNSGRYITIQTDTIPAGKIVTIDSRGIGEILIDGASYLQFIYDGSFFPLKYSEVLNVSVKNKIIVFKDLLITDYLTNPFDITYRSRIAF